MADKLYTAQFSIIAKVGETLNKEQVHTFKDNLSQASLINPSEHLNLYLPNINEDENPDLLPVAFDSAIVNLVNGNDDAILTSSALALAKSSPYKFINVEHNRNYIIGVVSSFGFASLEDKRNLTDEEVKDLRDPFYLCLGGVIWKNVDPTFAEMLEEADDSSSTMYKEFSTSWEIGFDEYAIALGSKRLKDATIIHDEERVKELSKYLKCNKGPGFLTDGTPVYRVVTDPKPIFQGVGITTTPAAAVSGIATASQINLNKNNKIISQSVNSSVIRHSMTIKDISEITDEKLTEITASSVRDFIKDQIRNKDKELTSQAEAAQQEQAKLQTEVESFKTQASDLEKNQASLQATIDSLQAELNNIKAAQDANEKAEKFNLRIQALSEDYNLDEQVRTIVASEIKDLDDAGFEAWRNKFGIVAIGLKKNVVASSDNTSAAQNIIASANVPASNIVSSPSSQSEMDARFKKAFKIEVSKNTIKI